jgi:hypothetical protein
LRKGVAYGKNLGCLGRLDGKLALGNYPMNAMAMGFTQSKCPKFPIYSILSLNVTPFGGG